MDFGALDGLVVCSGNNNSNSNTNSNSNSNTNTSSLISGSDLDPKCKWYGSGGGFLKQERSALATTEDEWREMKVAKISQDDFSKAMLLQQQQQHQRSNGSSAYSDAQNMLSFSSPNTHSVTLPYYARNTGGSMHGVIAGVRGPFTPSQWMELEHQALIYKYITANAPIPSNLLLPIRKALESAAFSAYPGAHLRHNAFGWGAFHLGFSNSSDPEPGRCRRTDGKKWRCSRDAVADQKYCERHMNRGRHRSRKPVEGQTTGHSVSNGSTTTTAAVAKLSASAAAVPTSSSTILSHLQHHNHHQHDICSSSMGIQPGSTRNPAASSQEDRNCLNKAGLGIEKIQDATALSVLSTSSTGLKENQLPILKEPVAQSEFGLVCSDSLLNPLQKNDIGGTKSQNSLRQFMDDWPHSDQTQLSISIPIGPASSSDFMSSTSSPSNERLNLSPLRMGLGMGNNNTSTSIFNKNNQRQQANWNPISWETSMGGPLGEVLHHSTNNSPSGLNLMTEGWDSSPRMALSPTGVLQKTVFGSLSNSSAGSSPRTENNLLGSTLISSSLPLL